MAFKSTLQKKWSIIWANIKYTFAEDTAYVLNNWFGLVTTLIFVITMMLYVNILYAKIDVVAGYGKNEILLFWLVSAICFHLNSNVSSKNVYNLISSVRNGSLDMILVKPLPHLFYISFRKISLSTLIINTFVQTAVPALLIDWPALGITPVRVLAAIPVLLLGFFCIHVFQFVLAMAVFWFGDSQGLVDLSWGFEYNIGRQIPFEGFSRGLQILFTTLIPVMFYTSMTTSVLVGKIDPLLAVVWVTVVAVALYFFKRFLWSKAIRNYTSASS